jgi:hypothetical protein
VDECGGEDRMRGRRGRQAIDLAVEVVEGGERRERQPAHHRDGAGPGREPRGGGRGEPGEAVGVHKRRRLREAAELLLRDDATVETVRFDVVELRGLRVRHLPGAF